MTGGKIGMGAHTVNEGEEAAAQRRQDGNRLDAGYAALRIGLGCYAKSWGMGLGQSWLELACCLWKLTIMRAYSWVSQRSSLLSAKPLNTHRLGRLLPRGKNMKKAVTALSLALLAAGTISATALDRRVVINNTSSYTIMEFYASNTGSESWEEDILGSDILPAGDSVTINIDDGSGYCKYDFLAVFEDGDEVISADNNVCELSEFNFTN
ncbi:hypothetical protein ACFOOL_06950 [Devosia honganensis]|uniref:Argininosuccinate lyase n=1 Tax=Devosia honganensis TaxID=1610527 RepID=A0ABV7X013_9HYPH